MTYFKRMMILLMLGLVTACNAEPIDAQALPQMEHFHTYKNVPEMYRLDPLTDIDIQAEAAILIHAVTGDVLFEKNADETMAVASMSKIMSELLVLEAIEAGALDWEDTVQISDYAYTISSQPGFASVYLVQGEVYTVWELFQAMAIRSANGATIALAEKLGGSEKEFVTLMNERAKQLDMQESEFVNSTGLMNDDLQNYHSTGSVDETNKMSARDLVTLAQYIIEQYPELLETTTMPEFMFHGQTFYNSNWMLSGTNAVEDITFTGVDGLKTGFTDEAGYGFTGTVHIDDRRFISVIIGTNSIEKRFLETKMLYETLEEQLVETVW